MPLMRTYLYFWITASLALSVSAFAAMASPTYPPCARDASPVRTDGGREYGLTPMIVAPEGAPHATP